MEWKELRERLGLSQNKFAMEMGIPVSTYRKWEQGKSRPPDYVFSMVKRVVDIKTGRKEAI